jgi:NhaA family Na+:H+ antiporter
MPRSRSFVSRIASALVRLAHGDSGAGIILIAAAAAALLAANTSLAQTYHHLLHSPFFPAISEPLSTIHGWINDALMAVFFFVVGLEIKREVLDGELASAARRRLPRRPP